MSKLNATHLKKLEDFLSENLYEVRYEKGNFKSGYCILEHKRIVVVNKYFDVVGRCNALTEIVNALTSDGKIESDANNQLFLKTESKSEQVESE